MTSLLASTHTLANFLEGDDGKQMLLILVGGLLGLVGISAWAATSISKRVSQERTRREIAAYVAEGSISPEQGERMIRAATQGDLAEKLADEGKVDAAVKLAVGGDPEPKQA